LERSNIDETATFDEYYVAPDADGENAMLQTMLIVTTTITVMMMLRMMLIMMMLMTM
jgi:hypothetical protein